MRVLLQRVTTARVAVASETVGRIDAGMLVLVGVGRDDDETTARRLAERVAGYRRPSFSGAAEPALGRHLYERFVAELAAQGVPVATGRFGADMQVHLVNDGPVSFVIDL